MDFVEGRRLVDAFRRRGRLADPVEPGCSASPSSYPRPGTYTRGSENRLLPSAGQGGHRRLAGRACRGRPARRAWLATSRRGGLIGRRPDPCLDRRRPASEQYEQLVADHLRGWEAVLGRRRVGSTRTPRPSTGPAGRPGYVLRATRPRFADGFHPPRSALAPGRDRHAKRGWRRRGSQPRAEAALRWMGLTLPISKFPQLTLSVSVRSPVDIEAARVDFSGDVAGRACASKFNITIR